MGPIPTVRSREEEEQSPDRASSPVSNDNDPVYTLLAALDLSSLASRLCRHLHCPPSRAGDLIVEYRRFLVMKYTQRDTGSGLESAALVWCPPILRVVWGLHVLDTRDYRAMCDAIGVWIDHAPADNNHNDDDAGYEGQSDSGGDFESSEDRDQIEAGDSRSESDIESADDGGEPESSYGDSEGGAESEPGDTSRIEPTLTCYKNHFNEDPPGHIWSPAGSSLAARLVRSTVSPRSRVSQPVAIADQVGSSATTEATTVDTAESFTPAQIRDPHALRPDFIRLYFDTLLSDTFNTIRPTVNFVVKPCTQFSKLVHAYSRRIQQGGCCADFTCIKTNVVGDDPLHEHEVPTVAIQGGTWIQTGDLWWGKLTVEQMGFQDRERVLVVVLSRESTVER